jgi:hypothetical protein
MCPILDGYGVTYVMTLSVTHIIYYRMPGSLKNELERKWKKAVVT